MMNPAVKKTIGWLHRWLGLVSGLIVFIVAITGCILAFEQEIKTITQPYQFVHSQDQPMQMPSQLRMIAAQKAFGESTIQNLHQINSIQYNGMDKAAIATYKKPKGGFTLIYLNPYNGQVLQEKVLNQDFFRIVLGIHFYLLLPPKIGQPIVASAVLIFVLILITGMVLWWPKKWNRANTQKSFRIKWKAGFKRVNYDLHNVLGFYSLLLTLTLALTGLVWGFEWFEKSVYFTTSGGKTLPDAKRPLSDTTSTNNNWQQPADLLWKAALQSHDLTTARFQINYPEKTSDVYATTFNPSQTTFYQREQRFFDQYSLRELKGTGINASSYRSATMADKLHRMNYDIHVGAIAGLPGKILAFMASLIAASLPITGLLIWLNKRKKTKQKSPGQ